MMVFEPPRLLNGESRELYRFLYDLTEKLNLMAEETSAEAIWTTTRRALQSPVNPGEQSGAVSNDEIGALRELIVGSADTMLRVSDTEFLTMSGRYVAKSEFGDYFENATVTIDGNAWGITQLYDYSAYIDSVFGDFSQDLKTWIKTGLLYYDSGTPVYGVGVGKIFDQTAAYGLTTDVVFDASKTYYEYDGGVYTEYEGDTSGSPASLGLYEAVISRSGTNVYSTHTADSIKFWEGGTELASISASELLFPNAHILGGTIDIGTEDPNNAGHYPFHVASDGGLTIGYEDNNAYPFTVTAAGALTATGATITGTLKAGTGSKIGDFVFDAAAIHSSNMTGLNSGTGVWVGTAGVGVRGSNAAYAYLNASDGKLYAAGATISGAITATSLNVSSTTTGTLNCSNLTVSNLSASAINSGTLSASYIKLWGWMSVYSSASASTPGGYLGYSTGFDGDAGTTGIGLKAYGTYVGQVKATSSGASIKYNGNSYGEVWVSSGGVGMKISDSYSTSTLYYNYDEGFAFRPASNNSLQLGTSNHKWGNTYCGTGAWSGSDRNDKNSISYNIDDYEAVFDRLQPVSFKFNDGESGRTHVGFIAQDVEQAILDSGMTTTDYACIAKYLKEDEEEYGYCLRYEEFIALNTLKIKKLEARVAALEGAQNG